MARYEFPIKDLWNYAVAGVKLPICDDPLANGWKEWPFQKHLLNRCLKGSHSFGIRYVHSEPKSGEGFLWQASADCKVCKLLIYRETLK